MNHINGKPSVFMAVENPSTIPVQTPTAYEEYLQHEVEDARKWAEEEAAWLADAEAQADYQAWCEEVDAGFPTDEDLDRMAEEAELESLGEAYLIGANTNHDAIWQAGGSV